MSIAPDLTNWERGEIKATLDPIRHKMSIAVCGADNYFNVGAIIRTAHLFLAKEIILVDIPEFYERATMGTHKWENITHVTMQTFLERTNKLSSSDNRVLVCLERRPDLETKSLYTFAYPENPILCFGSEKTGIPKEILEVAKSHEPFGGGIVSIPQYGIQNDMNLANAAAIAIYDWSAKHYRK